MKDRPATFPFLYTVDVLQDGIVKRVVAVSTLEGEVRTIESTPPQVAHSTSRHSTSRYAYLDGMRYNLKNIAFGSIRDILSGGDRDMTGTSFGGTAIGNAELAARSSGADLAVRALSETELAGLHVVRSDRDTCEERARRLLGYCFATNDESHAEGFVWAPLVEPFVGRTPYEAAMKASEIGFGTFDRWRTRSLFSIGNGAFAFRAGRYMALDRNIDASHGFQDVDPRLTEGPDDIVSNVPEAALNTLSVARVLRYAADAKAVGLRVPSIGEEAISDLDALVVAYEDVLSPPPDTIAAADTVLRCAETLTTRSGVLSPLLEGMTGLSEDLKWFSGYWDRRGRGLVAEEKHVRDVGYRGTTVEPDHDAETLAMGF